jgi:hypothetical protein
VHAGGGSPTSADRAWARHALGLDGAQEGPWSLDVQDEAWTLAG